MRACMRGKMVVIMGFVPHFAVKMLMHPIALLLALLLSPLLALAPPPSTPLPSGSSASNGRFSRASSSPTFPSTPLDAYVNNPDGPLLRLDRHRPGISFSGPGWKGHVLNMSSQKWFVDARETLTTGVYLHDCTRACTSTIAA